jgi:catechol 2,3-dioxygenase-like lactoylglutathione lyase family enzyme
MKKRVTGIGGIFFKAKNTRKLQAWYRKHLGLPLDPVWGGWAFHWSDHANPKQKGYTVWSAFDPDTDYFKPSKKDFMFNFRVANLRRVLAELKQEGVWVDPKSEKSEYGKFGWIMDCDGNRIELWEPPKEQPARKRRSGKG